MVIAVIGLVAVIVAVFGHPTQTVAAAVIVTALQAHWPAARRQVPAKRSSR